MRSFAFLALFALSILSACSLLPEAGDDTSTEITMSHLTQHWVSSYEEASEGSEVEIFRPVGYRDFPPSWFRMQYIFEEGGGCKWYYLAPNDAHHFKSGTWRLDADEANVLLIEQGETTVAYRLVELTEERLRMIRID